MSHYQLESCCFLGIGYLSLLLQEVGMNLRQK